MIQGSYLIWYKHKSYFHTHWQLFLLQIHPYIIVWYILQMALFLFCHIICYVVKTNIWYWDLLKTSRPKLQISKFVHFAEIFQKIIITTLKLNFWISGTFPICFGCFSLTNKTEKNLLNYRSFTKPYPCNIDSFKTTGLWSRPVTFESKMRPEIFKTKTETHKNGLKNKSQDFITANNPTKSSNQNSC